MPKILVIDDYPDNLISLFALLKSVISDAVVITAGSGSEGIEKAISEQPDTILLDIIMPGMDGFETCHMLKSEEKTKSIPVIMITAPKTDSASRIKALEIGADAFLSKPIEGTELCAQVRAMLRIKSHEDALKKKETMLQESHSMLGKEAAERTEHLARLAEAVRQAMDGIVITKPDGSIIFANPAFEKITGYRLDEVIGQNSRILKSGYHDEAFYKNFWETLLAGNRWIGRMINKRKDGSLYTAECSISPVKNAQGSLVNFVWITRDITAAVKMEKRINQAQKMEAIGTLAGGIAHNINNILGTILLNADLALDDVPSAHPVRQSLTEIHQACLRGREVIRQILSFSRLSMEEKKVVRLTPIVTDALKLVRSLIPTTIEIRRSLTTQADTILADSAQLNQVLINLCTNAAYAMREKGGVLEVALDGGEFGADALTDYPDLPPGRYVRLTVSDSGHGISPEIRERIFDPYFTTGHVGESSGLGLAVVHEIVREHGGVITVDSEPGKGARVAIVFPEAAPEAPVEVKASRSLPRGSERILFVDDEQPIVTAAVRMLERLGYQVDARMDSLEALEAFRSSPEAFDLVITDNAMPGMAGRELAGELMTIRPGIPVILCTGFSEQIDEKKAKELGIAAFAMKPIVMREFAGIIRKALDEK